MHPKPDTMLDNRAFWSPPPVLFNFLLFFTVGSLSYSTTRQLGTSTNTSSGNTCAMRQMISTDKRILGFHISHILPGSHWAFTHTLKEEGFEKAVATLFQVQEWSEKTHCKLGGGKEPPGIENSHLEINSDAVALASWSQMLRDLKWVWQCLIRSCLLWGISGCRYLCS